MTERIFYKIDGENRGPISAVHLKKLLQDDHFNNNAIVKLPNTEKWRRASSIKPKKNNSNESPEIVNSDPVPINNDWDSQIEEVLQMHESSSEFPILVDQPDDLESEEATNESIDVGINSSETKSATSATRYPELHGYISYLKTFIKLYAFISILGFGLLFLRGILALVVPTIAGNQVAVAFSCLVGGFTGIFSTVLLYIVVMSILELAKVIIDIEKNTRETGTS